jgi:hypothetical protein
MIRIIPDVGPPYYLIDTTGDGNFDIHATSTSTRSARRTGKSSSGEAEAGLWPAGSGFRESKISDAPTTDY